MLTNSDESQSEISRSDSSNQDATRAEKSRLDKALLDQMFRGEIEVAARASAALQSPDIDRQTLESEFQNLLREYKALLHQAQKLTRIGDSTQRKLLKTQEELEALNQQASDLYRAADEQRARAEEANRVKSELLAIAAHDLKNPLQSIMGFASLLILKPFNSDLVIRYAKIIESNSNRMLYLINDLLKSVRYESANFELQIQTSNIGEVLSTVIQNNSAQMVLKEQIVESRLAPDCYACVDVARIQEAMDNLISNAVKYSPIGKKIEVFCQKVVSNDPANARILIGVKDEGQGLSDEDKEKLFGRFQRLSAKPTGGEGSTGLGLSIVKQIVELHGGRVWAESEGKDKGATFFVDLPAAPFDEANQ